MKEYTKTKKSILNHFYRYPNMQLEDLCKFLFHSAFGCDHLISSLQKAEEYLSCEYNELKPTDCQIEKLDGDYSRVYLGILNKGLKSKTLAKLFFLSAKKEEKGVYLLQDKLAVLKDLILAKQLPFNYDNFCSFYSEWKNLNYPAIRHSKKFNEEYRPSYRVISNRFIPYLFLLVKIDKKLILDKKVKIRIPLTAKLFKEREKTLAILKEVYGDCNLNFLLREEDSKRYSLIIIS